MLARSEYDKYLREFRSPMFWTPVDSDERFEWMDACKAASEACD